MPSEQTFYFHTNDKTMSSYTFNPHEAAAIDELIGAPVVSNTTRYQRKALESQGDRFIPNRGSMDVNVNYNNELKKSLVENNGSAKILAFKDKAPTPQEGHQNELRVLYSQNKSQTTSTKKTTRNIPQAPERILDAPDLLDDYYLNLLDWGNNGLLAVALGRTVYLWNPSSGNVEQLLETEENDCISSVAWVEEGNYLAVGTNNADVQLWDAGTSSLLRTMKGHQARVGSLAWNGFILSSGSRDSNIHNHDVRVQQHLVSTFEAHQQEVCGLKWSPGGTQLASGGNDNMLHIWDMNSSTPQFSLNHHQAAVKALAWCPWEKNLLASGGGTADRCIKFWNTQTGALLNSIDTNSQVCALQWSTTDREIVSSHGFSLNQLSVWKYPSMAKVAELTGHTARVLHMGRSPDGQTIVSAGADETLRFWKIFSAPMEKSSKQSRSLSKPFEGGRALR